MTEDPDAPTRPAEDVSQESSNNPENDSTHERESEDNNEPVTLEFGSRGHLVGYLHHLFEEKNGPMMLGK